MHVHRSQTCPHKQQSQGYEPEDPDHNCPKMHLRISRTQQQYLVSSSKENRRAYDDVC
jgi:hypothetical protein